VLGASQLGLAPVNQPVAGGHDILWARLLGTQAHMHRSYRLSDRSRIARVEGTITKFDRTNPLRPRSDGIGGSQAQRRNFNQATKFFWFFFVHKKNIFSFPLLPTHQILSIHHIL